MYCNLYGPGVPTIALVVNFTGVAEAIDGARLAKAIIKIKHMIREFMIYLTGTMQAQDFKFMIRGEFSGSSTAPRPRIKK